MAGITNTMKDINWKQVLISILIGATVAFVTTFLEGLLDYLRGLENNVVGGAISSLWYSLKRLG